MTDKLRNIRVLSPLKLHQSLRRLKALNLDYSYNLRLQSIIKNNLSDGKSTKNT